MNSAVKIENLSKQYRLGLIGTGTLSHDLRRWWYLARGKEDPYLKIGDVNDRTIRGNSEYVWALRDINLEIAQGEVLGIIGKNGAGKSTLLKILSRVTAPTTGNITYRGRIGSLLEVGTGFHPELTGRENIYLNGAILGMKRNEIDRKFDEIVDFSGCERYIDTPVKRYSSGMVVRLGFAVAAFLEPEILVVDEVLAVGDAEFQDRAIGKMQEVCYKQGRTILFVSHNMAAIANLCKTCLLLSNGQVSTTGEVSKIIDEYLSIMETGNIYVCPKKIQKEAIFINTAKISFLDQNILKIDVTVESQYSFKCSIDFRFKTKNGVPVGFGSYGTFNNNDLLNIEKGSSFYSFQFPIEGWAQGKYFISIDLTYPDVKYYERLENILMFELVKKSKNDRRALDLNWNYGAFQIPVIKLNNK